MKIRSVRAELTVAFRNFAKVPIKVFCRGENKESRSFSSSDAGAERVGEKFTDVMEKYFYEVQYSLCKRPASLQVSTYKNTYTCISAFQFTSQF